MKEGPEGHGDAAELRRRAEQRLEERRRRGELASDEQDLPRLVEELQIHQFELEIQNEELQRTRVELDTSLRRYRDLYDGAPVGFVSLALDGAILEVNPVGETLLGQERSRLARRRFGDFVSPESGTAVSACLEAAVRTASRHRCEATLSTSAQRPLHVRIEAVASGDGRGCHVALVDVTDLKLAEAALEASEARFRRLFESSRDGILLLDAGSGAALAANPSLCRMLGRPAEAWLGRPLWEIGPLAAVAGSRQAFLESLSRGGLHRDHVAIETDDGGRVDVELSSHTYRVAGGNVTQVAIRDIGERLEAERDLAEMRNQLERARRLEAVARLAGGVAHEFNNQLGVILGYVELLQGLLPAEGKQAEKLDQIATAARYSADLTRQLVAFARGQVLRPRLLAPSTLIAEAAPRMAAVLGAEVEVALRLNAAGRIRADPDQLENALLVLAANARDAMPEGGTLTIETDDVEPTGDLPRHAELPPARYVTVTVTDTGGGLDETARARIFEPFFSTKPQVRGTGLSLAAVYGTVRQSGGYLFVESGAGPGASFRIYMPLEEEP